VAILFVEDESVESIERTETAKEAIASATFVRNPVRFFTVGKTDVKENELEKFLAVNRFPCFVIIADKGVLGTFYGKIEKEKLLEFMKTKMK